VHFARLANFHQTQARLHVKIVKQDDLVLWAQMCVLGVHPERLLELSQALAFHVCQDIIPRLINYCVLVVLQGFIPCLVFQAVWVVNLVMSVLQVRLHVTHVILANMQLFLLVLIVCLIKFLITLLQPVESVVLEHNPLPVYIVRFVTLAVILRPDFLVTRVQSALIQTSLQQQLVWRVHSTQLRPWAVCLNV